MSIQILFAVLAGILTIAAPCILPMLPILLGASVGQQSRQRPLFIVMGFIVTFAAASLLLSAIIQSLHLSPNLIRDIAIGLLAVFGIFLIWPKPFELLTTKLSGVINKAGQTKSQGNWGGLLLGLTLGLVWTPCAGPILGSILTLIATQGSTSKAAILIIAYALGAGIPMLIIAYGSQYITTKVRWLAGYSTRLQQIFGVLILLLAVAMFFQYDVLIENQLTAFFPQNTLENKLVGQTENPAMDTATNMGALTPPSASASAATSSPAAAKPLDIVKLSDYGQAPDFTGITNWLNLPGGQTSLTIAQLKGKVVLVDFWTYSCINCIRTLPFVTKWYNTYHTSGLVVVGVHTPEFAFEQDTTNVANAIKRFGINYPVAQDNNYGTWTAYNNQYWPAEYLINQQGRIVYEDFGEGNYNNMENAIRELLGYSTAVGAENGQDLSGIESSEMYFEPSRLENLTPSQQPSATPQNYTLPQSLDLNNFALGGTWQFFQDHAQLMQPNGSLELHFSSGKLYMVAAADQPVILHIMVDGKPQPDVTVQASQLYTLFDSTDYSEHTIVITIPQAGLQAFTFTFG
jgi:cytochrome c biogenesis protein CcdA/thiol-disulfide isomerase/thioredoxin